MFREKARAGAEIRIEDKIDSALGLWQSRVPMQKQIAKKHPAERAKRQIRSKRQFC